MFGTVDHQSFPTGGHSMHGQGPRLLADTLTRGCDAFQIGSMAPALMLLRRPSTTSSATPAANCPAGPLLSGTW